MTLSRKMIWILIGAFLTLMVIFFAYYHQLYMMNTRTANEFTVMNSTVNVGEVRTNYEDAKPITFFDKDELAARALIEVASIQKNHNLKMEVNYVFFDANNAVTEDETKIRSIQIKVDYYNVIGKHVSSTVNRFKIDELNI